MPLFFFVHGLSVQHGARTSVHKIPGGSRYGHDRRWGDTPVQSQSERDSVSSAKPSQAMRAADREPAGGEIPVELVCRQPLDDFPQ